MSHSLSSDQLDKAALNLAIEARQLLGIPITFHHQKPRQKSQWPPILHEPPTPLEFSRIISKHSPIIIRNCFGRQGHPFSDRPRLKKWKQNDYLQKKLEGHFKVTVTDDGKADDLKVVKDEDGKEQLVFGLPHQEELPMSSILTNISHPSKSKNPSKIYYLQSQNNNLKSGEAGDFSPLLQDLEVKIKDQDGREEIRTDLDWASEAIGQEPEATNVWIGSERSSSSMHRDHYENLFAVIRGRKLFTVFPPSEAHFLCDDDLYKVYQSEPSSSSSTTNPNASSTFSFTPISTPPIPWIPIDPTEPPTSERNEPHTRYGKGLSPLKIWVEEGEVLFLPSGWFHHVSQESKALLQRKVAQDTNVLEHQVDRLERVNLENGNHDEKENQNEDGQEGQDELEREEIGICLSVNWWYESECGFGDRWAWNGFSREVRRRLEGRWGEMEEEREKDQEEWDR